MRFVLLLACLAACALAQIKIDNSIADPEVVLAPPPDQTKQLCRIEGPPLDLMFVIDSSGSLRDKFREQIDTVIKVLNNVAISPESVRVAVVQYSTRPQLRFNFLTYNNRADMLRVVENLVTTGSTTNTGEALEFVYDLWTEANGMRPDRQNVKRILYLLSDGRSTDHPKDSTWGERLRQDKNIEMYAFGLGKYIDWPILREVITGSRSSGYDRIVNSENATAMVQWFAPWKGAEICDEVPVCIPGAHRPLDLMFIVDTSTSVNEDPANPSQGIEESLNFVRRVLNNVNVNPQATRVAMIKYSSNPTLVFQFNSPDARNNSAVMAKLRSFRAVPGTTHTADALKEASKIFDLQYGARGPEVKKLAIVISDGYSTDQPAVFARRLVELKQVDIFAVALQIGGRQANVQELEDIVVHRSDRVFPVKERVFRKGYNLVTFEDALLKYTDKSCPDLNITADSGVKQVRMPYETVCTPQGMKIKLRTRNPFNGAMYAVGFDDAPGCSITGNDQKETSMVVGRGLCGMERSAGSSSLRTKYTVRIAIRFHELVDTAADSFFDASCQYDEAFDLSDNSLVRPVIDGFNPDNIRCQYNIVPTTTEKQCEILDADVGNMVQHEWSCKGLDRDQFMLVHDCVADSDADNDTNLAILDHQGCDVDKYLMQTPVYDIKNRGNFVSVRSYIFKFPHDTIVRFRCLISICNTKKSGAGCQYAFNAVPLDGGPATVRNTPSACLNHPKTIRKLRREELVNYSNPRLNQGYQMTVGVEARRVNVFQQAELASQSQRKYCTNERRQRLHQL